jgi:ribosomal protein S27AE
MSSFTCPNCGAAVFKTHETVLVKRQIFIDTDHETGNRLFDRGTQRTQDASPWHCGRCDTTVVDGQSDILDKIATTISFDDLNTLP